MNWMIAALIAMVLAFAGIYVGGERRLLNMLHDAQEETEYYHIQIEKERTQNEKTELALAKNSDSLKAKLQRIEKENAELLKERAELERKLMLTERLREAEEKIRTLSEKQRKDKPVSEDREPEE